MAPISDSSSSFVAVIRIVKMYLFQVRKPTRSRVKEPFQNFPAGDNLESVEEEEGNELDSLLPSSSPAEDGRVTLACVSCRQETPFK